MIENDKKLLEGFLGKFPIDKLKDLKLERYTNTGDDRKNTGEDGNERDDFTYWVEWKLDSLGSIRGNGSYKFGIYKCKSKPKNEEKEKKRKEYVYDEKSEYAWVNKYEPTDWEEKDPKKVFENIKEEIVNVVAASSAELINYTEIENANLDSVFKWKVAFLYSGTHEDKLNVRLVPVYQKAALYTAAKRLDVLPVDSVTIATLQEKLVEHFNTKSKEPDHSSDYNDIFAFGAYVWKIGNSDLSQSNQIIKYGAPGTGKTYTAKQEAKDFFEIWKLDTGNTSAEFDKHYEFVQFHPSYSHEDFIEGIKPVMKKGKTELELRNGIFKKFCRKAAEYEIWILQNRKNRLLHDKKLNEITVGDVKKLKNRPSGLVFPENVPDNDKFADYIPPYFFVIDEINRADLSRVFGELMYCLEYRGYEGRIKTQYSELESEETGTIFYEDNGEHWFFIPNNVYIIGTMNTIDRSIESFDFALRRRFLWQRINPDESVLKKYFEDKGGSKWAKSIIPLWTALNNAIATNTILGHDYQIGHSYLMKLDKYPNCTKMSEYRDIIWEKHIKPILEEYFRGMGKEAEAQIKKLENIFKKATNSKSKEDDSKNTNSATVQE